jgi:hypothetical protein
MTCPVCGAPIRHELGKSQIQYQCGTSVTIKTYFIGSDAVKGDLLFTGKCATARLK